VTPLLVQLHGLEEVHEAVAWLGTELDERPGTRLRRHRTGPRSGRM
jgi:hypothetical protein